MKKNIGELSSEIFALLNGQKKEDINKILASVSTLLGVEPTKVNQTSTGNIPGQNNRQAVQNGMGSNSDGLNAKTYFDQKEPKTKGEEFAVAAKFRLETNAGDVHTKDDLKSVIKNLAKRGFNESKFARDMDNAVRQAKFFMAGEQKGEYILSVVGEKYIDALPDRSAAAASRKSTKPFKRSKKKGTKKSAK
jgi:hypothetical protein